ncbi:hypothetical protein GTS_27520 [Gandjariella thermophila]|uniref:Uncharacterized protein n=1 Tax=Gandjariella thermophila TaxID=1931992 RepID=A0A4D4J9N2_9PSEU|nr:hypothetical protein GTS_27520 [Gandjariella thermophila]
MRLGYQFRADDDLAAKEGHLRQHDAWPAKHLTRSGGELVWRGREIGDRDSSCRRRLHVAPDCRLAWRAAHESRLPQQSRRWVRRDRPMHTLAYQAGGGFLTA